ncbi:MAG: LamG domain-containing protein [Sedimentisphaerales bacterium]|nr:LamG domain-containing protein [Sedimentisphaerales bacterium]
MNRQWCYLTSIVFVLVLSTDQARAGVEYGEPDGGWTYIYTGDAGAPGGDFTALDGTWSHNNGSDSWDESQIGFGLPGGVNVLTEDGVTFVRIQDTGDPRDHGGSDPSNRKIFFGHQLIDEIDQAVADEILTVHGITISFRARLSTTPPLDDVHPDGGGAVTPWSAGGDGYVNHDGGKGSFGVHQESGGLQTISFNLSVASDDGELPADGLTMNKLNGTAPSGDVDIQGDEPGTVNILEMENMTSWHEFWITIEPDTSGGGTHKVLVYADGLSTPSEFHVTSGTGGDFTESYISLGVGATPQAGAIDVDFMAYKEGIVTPIPSNPYLARAVNPTPGTIVSLHAATPFGWTPGEGAVQHDLYLGTEEADVNDADTTDTTGIYQGRLNMPIYTPTDALELGQTYYWRVDEIVGTTIHKGSVWSFTILDYLPIDDFEGYTDDDLAGEAIWQTWIDGYGVDENGAQVGYLMPPYAERTIVHGGSQSMPFIFNNTSPSLNSEVVMTLDTQRDWTEQGVKALSLWFRGYPPPFGDFMESPAGTFTMTGEGADIAGTSDQFHFAWKEATGAVEIVAKINSIQNTHSAAKAGVMIRNTLDADSAHVMVAVTPGSGVWFGYRNGAGQDITDTTQADITAPQWVKLERTVGGMIRAYYSADGATWTQIGTTSTVTMSLPLYIGLAVTSHNSGVPCEAVFSNVTNSGTGQWANQDIGLVNNDSQPMYIAVASGNGATATVYYDDPEATLISNWTNWNIDVRDFSDQGVDLTDVGSMTIGVGDKSTPSSGAMGTVFIDDIGLYRPRYVPDKVQPLRADFTNDGVVDYSDLEIMMADWLETDLTRSGPLLTHYTFDEGAGTVAADSSGQSSDSMFSGTAGWDANGRMGAAASFDGGVGEVRGDCLYLNGLDAISFGAWIKSNVVGSDSGCVIFANPAGNDQRDFRYDAAGGSGGGTNVIKFGVSTEEGSHENESASNVQTTEWQHVMVTWASGQTAKLYVNGVLNNLSYEADVISGTTTGYTDVIIGRGGKDTGGSWDGLIDDVRVYEVALTAQQVQTVMNGGDLPAVDTYVPLTSPANISDEEPANSKSINLKDFTILADEWLNKLVWPMW